MKTSKDYALELAKYFDWDEKSEQVGEVTKAIEAYNAQLKSEIAYLQDNIDYMKDQIG